MSVQAYGGAQSPLLTELLPPVSVPPPPFAPFSGSSPLASGDDTQPLVIEVPSGPGRLKESKSSNDNTLLREEIERLRMQQNQFHTTIQPSEPSPTPPSAIQKLIASIRQNLQEVKSVLLHHPAPTTGSKTRTDGIAEETVDEDPGNTQRWPCKWFGVCGTIQWAPDPRRMARFGDEKFLYDTGEFRKTTPEDRSSDSRVVSEIPKYVFEHAPLVHLFSGEEFWPCDMAEHLEHVTPNLNYTPILSRTENLNLSNLADLDEYDKGRFVYLESNDNVEERPDWLGGQKNVPNVTTENLHNVLPRHPHSDPRNSRERPLRGGRSDAPAVLIVVNKGHGIVDAFWFYFYSYNLGRKVLNVRFGNHVGDWEHSLVRFQHGKPKVVFFSEHFFGTAYTYDAVEKMGKRPVIYSATGTHAMYATPGVHPYILPFGILRDETDRGPLWDPLLNTLSYTYTPPSRPSSSFSSSSPFTSSHSTPFPQSNHTPTPERLTPSTHTPHAPTRWFFYNGHWGDKLYPASDSRQYQFAGQHHYVSGPLGPRFKHLMRRKVCQGRYQDRCVVRRWLGEEEVEVWPRGVDGVGDWEMEDAREEVEGAFGGGGW